MNKNNRQSGAVSLFVVIFAALLMTVVTISFIQLMLKDQRQATTSDLSQSAYDSAQAGVEDAKRLLLLDQSCRNNTAGPGVNCVQIANALNPIAGTSETECDALAQSGLVVDTNGETLVQQSVGDNAEKLDQAYTCVKIGVNTDDYKGQLAVNESNIIPLRGLSDFDAIELSWFTRDDIAADTNSPVVGFPSVGPNVDLPQLGDKWRFNYPALMRTQFMQTGSSFKLDDFNDSQAGNRSNANTLFLYPSATGLTNKDFALDARRSPANAPQQAKCNTSFVDGEYACTTVLSLPAPINGSAINRNAYLHLGALYNGAHYKVSLKKAGIPVQFDRVQPVVDSTGRANNMFRRVQARVELKSDFTYPNAEINLEGDLCKNFTVTDQDSGYSNSATCAP